jgi:UDP-galactopyranose mutase
MSYQNDNNNRYSLKKKNKEIALSLPNLNGNGNGHSSRIKDVICFAHLRWNFVFQRPQHILSRWAKEARVFYFEEPIYGKHSFNYLKTVTSKENANIFILTPYIQEGYSEKEVYNYLEECVNKFIRWNQVKDYLLWYLTPMSMPFTSHLTPKAVIYDCMDELSLFKGAHPDMLKNEMALMKFADAVFTGGYNLYEYKKDRHHNIHPFPSSVDKEHFEGGINSNDPEDQKDIPHSRVGFFGVVDERFDIELLSGLAKQMPTTHFVIIGPVVKIDQSTLPKYPNIHYLGQKRYEQLPAYLANWDVAFLPFAKNESTRFISPTKTPEYLCAGKPVVSTSIVDVKRPYGDMGLVYIADTVKDFAEAIKKALKQGKDEIWKNKVKEFLKTNSWDLTFSNMKKVIYETLEQKEALRSERISKMMAVKVNSSSVSKVNADTNTR